MKLVTHCVYLGIILYLAVLHPFKRDKQEVYSAISIEPRLPGPPSEAQKDFAAHKAPKDASNRNSDLSPGVLIPTQALGMLTLPIVSEFNGIIEKKVADALGLTNDQLAACNAAIQRTQDKLKQIEESVAVSTSDPTKGDYILIPAFAEEGARIKNELAQDIKSIVSPDIQNFMLEGLFQSGTFAKFGSLAREIYFEETEFPASRHHVFNVTYKDADDPDQDTTIASSMSSVWKDRYSKLFQK
jgi:hypothetical protein